MALEQSLRITLIVSNLAGGGAEKAMVKMATLLSARGHRVDVLLLEDRREHVVPPEVRVTALSAPGKLSHGWFGKRRAAWRLRRFLEAKPWPDLIVSTLPFADEICHIARLDRHWCRIANTLSAEISGLARADRTRAARRRARYVSMYAHHPLIAVSQGVADDLRKEFGLDTRIAVIPNPFDLDAIRGQALQATPELPARPYVIHVGRFAPQKRHDLLLDAWTRLPMAPDLVLLADPDPSLRAMITERGLEKRVHIAGFRPNPYPWMASARLLVLCSDHEGLPNVLLEAMACGTPVVSTDCPSGPAEILRGLPECLVPCGDANALAATVASVLLAPPDLTRMDFAPYHPERVACAWEALASASRVPA